MTTISHSKNIFFPLIIGEFFYKIIRGQGVDRGPEDSDILEPHL